MIHNEDLDSILEMLRQYQLCEAIGRMEAYAMKYPDAGIAGHLAEIRNDYQLMSDYWAKGYKDPQLEQVYARLIQRMYRLAANQLLAYNVVHSPAVAGVFKRVRSTGRDWSVPALRSQLESFVSDVALLELEPEHVRSVKKAEIYSNHLQLMNDLFDYIWTSRQWKESIAEAFEELLLSPTVDTVDQQLIVSAVMLSAMNIFDINKFSLLIQVYRKSKDENVRQRALVGWVLSLGSGLPGIFEDEKRAVDELLTDAGVRSELTELQIQMLYCVSAEQDNNRIQKEIMPDLLQHNTFRITPNGIEEKEDDPMQDILDPEASERNMEKVEESFRKMMDMQQQGSDIYFGGFSQMKRFPFFRSISNWFVPFYAEHPEVHSMFVKASDLKLVRMIVDKGPFCNSDKYSLVFAMRHVMERIPQNMREMLMNGDALGIGGMATEDVHTPAYIRRIYLQDLYRFFRLYPMRSQFYNPFNAQEGKDWNLQYAFFADGAFCSTPLEKSFNEIVAFMVKRKMYQEAMQVLDNYSDEARDYQFWMLCGHVLVQNPAGQKHFKRLAGLDALGCFSKALAFNPADVKALAAYARTASLKGLYREACDAYARLLEAQPDNKNYTLYYGTCLVNLDSYEEALKLLYKLHYEYPGHASVNRVMARALMGSGKYEQSLKIYHDLYNSPKRISDDLLNHACCEWLSGSQQKAAQLMAEYLQAAGADTTEAECRSRLGSVLCGQELQFLQNHGITPTEIQLMIDLACSFSLR